MSYTHLTTTERVKIETYLELGMSIRSIARRSTAIDRLAGDQTEPRLRG
ncbi:MULTISPECIES: helix-turn-helix domain-containing protein [unclassified Exiguobacterium]|nr:MULTISPECIES: helix-turn-helix domain-containing protein [unclassified Exiguobacterium]